MPKWFQHPVTAMPAREQRAASEAVGTPGGGQKGPGEGTGAPGRCSSCVAGRGYTLWLRSLQPFPLVIFSGLMITGTAADRNQRQFSLCPSPGATVPSVAGLQYSANHRSLHRNKVFSLFLVLYICPITQNKKDPCQISSVAQSCPTLCDPMDCSTPGFPVHHQLLELTQTHVHPLGDAIQPSHSLSPPPPHLQSFPASGSFTMCHFFTSGGQSIGASASASVLPMNIQD